MKVGDTVRINNIEECQFYHGIYVNRDMKQYARKKAVITHKIDWEGSKNYSYLLDIDDGIYHWNESMMNILVQEKRKAEIL